MRFELERESDYKESFFVFDHLVGRVIVDFKKDFRQSYIYGASYIDEMIVGEMRRDRLTIADFPGYHSVPISMPMLKRIINLREPSWEAALSNIGGICIIVDTTKEGGQYVGSAYGGDGIWQRWIQYAKNGHGENKKLKEFLINKGSDYSDHFQFSILELCDLQVNADYVIKRESYWKNVLRTRDSGLNSN